jgi:hypothetical protein
MVQNNDTLHYDDKYHQDGGEFDKGRFPDHHFFASIPKGRPGLLAPATIGHAKKFISL